MDAVLLVSASEKGIELIYRLLGDIGRPEVLVANSGAEARRMLAQYSAAVVVINTPLGDEYGHNLAIFTAETTSSGVVMIVKNEAVDEMEVQVEHAGVLVVPKPLNRMAFGQTMRLAGAIHKRIIGLKKENSKLQQKIEEIGLVNRAKYVLMQSLRIDEPQAHRYIEKQAMDMRMTKKEVAEGILSTYEN